MSWCAKEYCEIYRNKKYCSRRNEKQEHAGVCKCQHAKRACQVNVSCSFEDRCGYKREDYIESSDRLEEVLDRLQKEGVLA